VRRALKLVVIGIALSTLCCKKGSSPTNVESDTPTPSFSASYTSSTNSLLIAACYYPWYRPNSHWAGSNLRDNLQPPQPPQLGNYDCMDQSVISQHVSWSKQAGIDFWVSSWWGPGSSEDDVIRNGHLTNRDFRAKMGYCLLYEPTQGNPIDVSDVYIAKFMNDLRYLDTTHFKQSNYLKIDQEPVLYIYLTRTMTGNVQKLFADADTLMVQRGYAGLYVVGDEVYWGQQAGARVDWMEAVTSYNPHTSQSWVSNATMFVNNTRDQLYDPWMTSINALGKSFWVDVIPGFNDWGMRPEAAHPVIPRGTRSETWPAMLQAAKVILKKQIVPLKVLVVTSWNEWHEDTEIEPTTVVPTATQQPTNLTRGNWYYGYGTQLLDTLSVFKQSYNP
jgi:glycoprotein endo-alpha-1,2-mannosidase